MPNGGQRHGRKTTSKATHPIFSGLVFIYLRKSLPRRCLRRPSRRVVLQGACGFLTHSWTCAFAASLCAFDGTLLRIVRPHVVIVSAWRHFPAQVTFARSDCVRVGESFSGDGTSAGGDGARVATEIEIAIEIETWRTWRT